MGLPAQSRTRVGAWCVGAFLLTLLATSVPAGAAPDSITGKLSKPGYTVIALASNGKAKAVRASQSRFRLRPPATSVTLHLRAPNGSYAGPVVVGRKKKGKRAVLGVKAGARLGRIKVRGGYAKVSKRLRKEWVDARRTARAREGVPIGTRNFGRVRAKRPRAPVPGDPDLDGVPDPFDIDDDGDLILDDLDRSTAARAAQVLDNPLFRSTLTLGTNVANANARGLGDQQIEAAFLTPGAARLQIGVPPGGSTELDCGGRRNASPPPPWVGGLPYCTLGGTGTTGGYGPSPHVEFPECCDPDNDGFGTLVPLNGGVALAHGATTAQITTGQVLIKRVNDANGVEIAAFPATLQYVFATVPALISYDDDGPGGEEPTALSYPYPAGEQGNFPVSDGPEDADSDVEVTLKFWRPQRRRIAKDPKPKAGESATWTDIGGLHYSAQLGNRECPQSALSDPSSGPVPDLLAPSGSRPGFTDRAGDQPANAANTLTFTVNLTQCQPSPSAGSTPFFHLVASPPNGGGFAEQELNFQMQ